MMNEEEDCCLGCNWSGPPTPKAANKRKHNGINDAHAEEPPYKRKKTDFDEERRQSANRIAIICNDIDILCNDIESFRGGFDLYIAAPRP